MHVEYTAAEAAHFWSRVDRTDADGCWPWTGGRTNGGYGTLTFRQRAYRASRFAYALTYGDIPDGLGVLHHCDNPPCVRPDHLFLGDQRANMQDAFAKGRLRLSGPRGATHHSAKMTPDLVREIRCRARNGEMHAALAREYGVAHINVSRIVRRLTWKHVDEAQ